MQEAPRPGRDSNTGHSTRVPLWLAPLLGSVAFTAVALVGAVALLFPNHSGLWENAAATVVFAAGLGGALILARRLALMAAVIARAEVLTFELESAAEVLDTRRAAGAREDLTGLREDLERATEMLGELLALGAGSTAVPLRVAIMSLESLLESKPDSSPGSGAAGSGDGP